MSRIGRAASRVALRLYPASWRERYADEVAALVDDADGGLRDAADLGRGAIAQHLNGGTPMRFEPAHRHPRPFALAAAGLWLFRRFLLRRLGGLTGDTLGAAQQIGEIALLLGLALTLG